MNYWLLVDWMLLFFSGSLLSANLELSICFLGNLLHYSNIFCCCCHLHFYLVLPVNYYGHERIHKEIPSESLDAFTIKNVKEGSEWNGQLLLFSSRLAMLLASQVLQSSNPMFWIATLMASSAFMLVFLVPATFVQGLTELDKLQLRLSFLRGILKNKFIIQLVTGYLPIVILILFLYAVPPKMMLFSAVEGCISRSGRKTSACYKVLYFTIWNVFEVNIFTGPCIRQLNAFS
ncbi:CSC1-like protein RXW8 [Quillaja saponaria]|uniref:CSC1-like protein RXW8 n=1 Tax=Quillaja saponaria TaxID=32244 RepID=A0AAD7PKC2_QUISA|nr:CSC1-like protein RXW8 [Quillaja saponaria]